MFLLLSWLRYANPLHGHHWTVLVACWLFRIHHQFRPLLLLLLLHFQLFLHRFLRFNAFFDAFLDHGEILFETVEFLGVVNWYVLYLLLHDANYSVPVDLFLVKEILIRQVRFLLPLCCQIFNFGLRDFRDEYFVESFHWVIMGQGYHLDVTILKVNGESIIDVGGLIVLIFFLCLCGWRQFNFLMLRDYINNWTSYVLSFLIFETYLQLFKLFIFCFMLPNLFLFL